MEGRGGRGATCCDLSDLLPTGEAMAVGDLGSSGIVLEVFSGMRRRGEESKDVVARRISSHAIRGCFFAAWIQRSTLYINKTIRPGINSLPEPPKAANPIWTSTALSTR